MLGGAARRFFPSRGLDSRGRRRLTPAACAQVLRAPFLDPLGAMGDPSLPLTLEERGRDVAEMSPREWPAPALDLGCNSAVPLCTSPLCSQPCVHLCSSRLNLGCTSAVPRLNLSCTRLYLGCNSAL